MSLVRFRSEAPVKETQQGFQYAAVAHLVERHLAKVEVASSSLVGRSITEQQQLLQYGPVAQLVRAPACHAGGRRFEPDPGRRRFRVSENDLYASVAQSVEQGTENPRVIGSIPIGGTSQGNPAGFPICGRSSSGRAPPCQGGGSEFEPRRPLQTNKPLQNMIRRVMQRLFCTLKAFLELEKEGKTQ